MVYSATGAAIGVGVVRTTRTPFPGRGPEVDVSDLDPAAHEREEARVLRKYPGARPRPPLGDDHLAIGGEAQQVGIRKALLGLVENHFGDLPEPVDRIVAEEEGAVARRVGQQYPAHRASRPPAALTAPRIAANSPGSPSSGAGRASGSHRRRTRWSNGLRNPLRRARWTQRRHGRLPRVEERGGIAPVAPSTRWMSFRCT